MRGEIDILGGSYSKEELAEILLVAIDIIMEKNKLLEKKDET